MFGMKRDEPEKVAPTIAGWPVLQPAAPIPRPVAGLEHANEVDEDPLFISSTSSETGKTRTEPVTFTSRTPPADEAPAEPRPEDDAWVGEARAAMELLNRLVRDQRIVLRLDPLDNEYLRINRLVSRTVYEERPL